MNNFKGWNLQTSYILNKQNFYQNKLHYLRGIKFTSTLTFKLKQIFSSLLENAALKYRKDSLSS